MDLALSSARLSASTEPISGFGAPAFMQNPTAERVISACVPTAILLACASPSRSGRGNKATSKAAPPSISLVKTDVSANLISTLLPVARSNSGTTSSISDFIAPPLKTLIWLASAILASAPSHYTKGPPTWRPFAFVAYAAEWLFRCGQRHRLDSSLRRNRRLLLLLAFSENERIAFGRNLADLVHHRAGSRRDQPADDDVLLEAVERVGLAVDCGFSEHARRLLERG